MAPAQSARERESDMRATSQSRTRRTNPRQDKHEQANRREHRYVRALDWRDNPQELSPEAVRAVLGLPRSDRYAVEG